MRQLIPSLLGLAALCSAGATAAGTQAPRWLRDVALSPDGKTLAFTYKGDIFTVPTSGGRAFQLTSNPAYESTPVWTPDSKRIAFRSNREGSDDIFIVDAQGGTPVRLTTHSGHETPLAFLDDTHLIYGAAIAPSRQTSRGPWLSQTYLLDISEPGLRPQLYLSLPLQAASADAKGRLLYQDRKGFENLWRKHERSSGTADIWLHDNGNFTKLTNFNGHDLNPVWASDGNSFFYISEEDGTLNVYKSSADGKSRQQLTRFQRHPVRSLSAAADGTIAFSWDGDIYTMREGSEPRKLDVTILADEYDSDLVKKYVNSGATSMAVSPSGEEVAIVLRGDIYVTDTKYKTTKRITNTPAQERTVAFSPDGRTLVYDSDRNGYWQLFTASIKDPAEKRFAYATDIVEEPLYKCATAAQQPAFSPDGKKVAFLENRTELRVIDVKDKKVNTALDGKYNYSYVDGDVEFAWSPDSQWLLASYIGDGGWNNTDVALVKADGSKVIDLTESGFTDSNPKWALDGGAITYATAKYGYKSQGSWGNQDDIMLMALNPDTWDNFNLTEEEAAIAEKAKKDAEPKEEDKKEKKDSKKGKKNDKAEKKEEKKPMEFDLENSKYRTRRLTGSSAFVGDYFLSPKGDKFYYVANATEGGNNLLVRDTKKGDTKVLLKGVSGGLEADKKGENLFVISRKGVQKINLAQGDIESVEFEAEYDRKPSLEREYIFDHMLRQVNDKFYDENLHGVDWEYYGQHYREFLPYIDNNRDFAILMSEILGELNASHTGASTSAGYAKLSTADLGAFFDDSYTGDGLKVAELLPQSPLATKKAGIGVGDIIMSVDGKKIEAGKDYYPILEGKAGRKVRLEVKKTDGKTVFATVKLLSAGELSSMLYRRWVEHNQAIVDSVSGGRLAYVHIQGMNSPSYRTVYDELLGKYRNREAAIVDTRFNGGGWLHNDIAVLLSGKEYVQFMPRGRKIGSEPFSQWHKPSVMLVNEGNYSDAHGTPYTYKTLGIGELVGAPVPGTMTAVWWETQIDPSIVFGIPQVTNADMNGKALENVQLDPDVLIYNAPADELRGHDAQLIGAVKRLLEKLDSK